MVRKVRPKKSYFSSAWEYVKLPFSLRVPKKSYITERVKTYIFFELNKTIESTPKALQQFFFISTLYRFCPRRA
jgi:hypothetical protein